MTELLTAAQMRAIEQAAIASGAVTGLELMERAGRGVVEAILEWRPELANTAHRAVVLCGPGNNGGDGFVVARLLKQRGWEVEVFLYGADPDDLAKLAPDAAENARRWREMGEVRDLLATIDQAPVGAVLIDAIFGTGLARPLDGRLLAYLNEAVASCSAHNSPAGWTRLSVAVDCPSGLCVDSGRHLDGLKSEEITPFDLTVTFHGEKIGHHLDSAPTFCGALARKDIGLPSELQLKRRDALRIGAPLARRNPREWQHLVDRWLLTDEQIGRMPHLKAGEPHKYSHGHALVLSGGFGKGGAARLSARGALRIGAGLVTIGCPPEALPENAAQLDAIMLAQVPRVEELRAELAARKIRSVCIGPGFGGGDRLRAFVEALLGGVEPCPTVVLDADALTEYRDHPETLFALLHDGCVLTPHEGEFGRLFPDLLEKLKEPAIKGPAYSKVDATREAAARAGCVVLFKGADTVIADPDGRCAINSAQYDRKAPWLATAGSGDVLAGFITGLLARGLNPMAAAETAAWLHVECARKFGPGLIAEDLPEQLPAVFRDLGM